jgi:hypothetical protein
MAGAREFRRLVWLVVAIAVVSAVSWVTWGIFAWIGVMAGGALLLLYRALRRPSSSLLLGSDDDEIVALGHVPNAAIAEMVCTELKANGIAAFFKSTLPIAGANPVTYPGGPCALFVRQSDAERARELLPASRTIAS